MRRGTVNNSDNLKKKKISICGVYLFDRHEIPSMPCSGCPEYSCDKRKILPQNIITSGSTDMTEQWASITCGLAKLYVVENSRKS